MLILIKHPDFYFVWKLFFFNHKKKHFNKQNQIFVYFIAIYCKKIQKIQSLSEYVYTHPCMCVFV